MFPCAVPPREQNAAAFGGDPQQVPDRAITQLAEILAAEEVHLIVTGHAKREILARVFATGCDPSCPPVGCCAIHG